VAILVMASTTSLAAVVLLYASKIERATRRPATPNAKRGETDDG
jgi:hypothetical protein